MSVIHARTRATRPRSHAIGKLCFPRQNGSKCVCVSFYIARGLRKKMPTYTEKFFLSFCLTFLSPLARASRGKYVVHRIVSSFTLWTLIHIHLTITLQSRVFLWIIHLWSGIIVIERCGMCKKMTKWSMRCSFFFDRWKKRMAKKLTHDHLHLNNCRIKQERERKRERKMSLRDAHVRHTEIIINTSIWHAWVKVANKLSQRVYLYASIRMYHRSPTIVHFVYARQKSDLGYIPFLIFTL